MINKFVKLIPECEDWEAWYFNGMLIAEGHKVRVEDILDALANVLPNIFETIVISDEKAEYGFKNNLSDMIFTGYSKI